MDYRNKKYFSIEKKLVKAIITSKPRAEEYINKFIAEGNVDRKQALERLKKLGINFSRLS